MSDPPRRSSRSSLARCERHGTIYDARRSDCPACLRERGQRPPPSRRAMVAVLGALLGLSILLGSLELGPDLARFLRSRPAEPGSPAQPAAPLPPGTVAQLEARRFASTLEGLVATRGTALLGFPDPGTVALADVERVTASYQEFFTGWNDALDAAARDGGGVLRYRDQPLMRLADVSRLLATAFDSLRAAVPAGTVRTRAQRETALAQARALLGEAGSRLDSLEAVDR